MSNIFTRGTQGRFEDKFNANTQRAISNLDENRQKQQNIEQSGFLGQFLQGLSEKGDEASVSDMLAQLYGNPNITPENKQTLGKQLGEHYSKKEIEKGKKKEENIQPLLGGLDTIKRQRELLKSEYIGPRVSGLGHTNRKDWFWTSPEGVKARSEYERLGKSLISLSSNIPIRNQREFDILAHDLYDPEKSKEEVEGILDAMERIINNSIGPQGQGRGEGSNIPESPEGWRGQNEKPQQPFSGFGGNSSPVQEDFVYAINTKTGKRHRIPKNEFQPHPLYKVVNQ